MAFRSGPLLQLHDAVAVLELDRVLDATPDELDRDRVALQTARQKRREQISRTTDRLTTRIDAAAGTANAQVLLHPLQSGAVVQSSNRVAADVVAFNERLGIESGRQTLEARRWTTAAGEVRDKVFETGTESVDAAMRFGGKTLDGAKHTTGRLSTGLGQRLNRLRRNDPEQKDRDDLK